MANSGPAPRQVLGQLGGGSCGGDEGGGSCGGDEGGDESPRQLHPEQSQPLVVREAQFKWWSVQIESQLPKSAKTAHASDERTPADRRRSPSMIPILQPNPSNRPCGRVTACNSFLKPAVRFYMRK